MLNQEPVTKMVDKRKLRWFGNLIRMETGSLAMHGKHELRGRGGEEGQG
jgi:hypothetical protein